jgi:ENTS family enterobactin (siderophore) exporter
MPPLPTDDGAPPVRGWRSVAQGFGFLASRKNILMTFLVDIAAMVFAFPRVLFPAVAALALGGGETTVGALTAAIAVGSALATVLSGPLGRVRRQGRAIAWSVGTWGAGIAAFGIVIVLAGERRPSGVVWWALLAAGFALAVAGAADAVSAVFRGTILQAATPDALRGRLQGVFIVVVTGGPRLGELLTGADATLVGEGWAAVIGGLVCVAALGGLLAWQRGFLAYDARHPSP